MAADSISYANSNRMYQISGLASGMDTNSLMEGLMSLERIPIDRDLGKMELLSFQQKTLQEINLKVYNLRNKATDLTFSKAFRSKDISSSNSNQVSATATTEAETGSFRVTVNQLATKTAVSSRTSMSGKLHRGRSASGTTALNGLNISANDQIPTLTGIDFSISVDGIEETLDLSSLTTGSSFQAIADQVNSEISANSNLNGKVSLDYDYLNHNLKFVTTGTTENIQLNDKTGNFLQTAFDASGTIDLNSGNSIKTDIIQLTAGIDQTLGQLGVTIGTFDISLNGGGPVSLTLAGLTSSSTVEDALGTINAQIADDASLKGNVRAVFDDNSQKLAIELTNSFDNTSTLQLDDNTSNFISRNFGGASVTATLDSAEILANESFGQSLTSGVFTLDGIQISVDTASDNLGDVLDRINSSTALTATYDSTTDQVTVKRNDGQNIAFGVGSTQDTSNFLSVIGIASNTQAAGAVVDSTNSVGAVTAVQAETSELNSILGNFTTPLVATNGGILDVTVDGVTHQIAYSTNAGGDTLNDVLDRISAIDGVESAAYDVDTGKIAIQTESAGSSASLKVAESVGSTGNLASSLNLSAVTELGKDVGNQITSNRPLSGVKLTGDLANSGLALAPTLGNFSINGVNISVNAGDSFETIIGRINDNSTIGVDASYNSLTNALELTARTTGNSSIQLGSAADTSNFLLATGLLDSTQSVGKNTEYQIDGGPVITTTETTVKDVKQGINLAFVNTTSPDGITITIKANVEETKKAITDFIDSYNELMVDIDKQLSSKRDYELEPLSQDEKNALSDDELKIYQENLQKGLLANDPTLKMIQRRFRNLVFSPVNGIDSATNSLAQIGMSTGAVGASITETRVGKIQIIDEGKFEKALAENIDGIKSLFSIEGGSDDSNGIARRIKDLSGEFSNFDGILTQKAGRLGVVSNSSMGRQLIQMQTRIDEMEANLFRKEDDLTARFARMEQAVNRINTSGNQLLASLGGG